MGVHSRPLCNTCDGERLSLNHPQLQLSTVCHLGKRDKKMNSSSKKNAMCSFCQVKSERGRNPTAAETFTLPPSSPTQLYLISSEPRYKHIHANKICVKYISEFSPEHFYIESREFPENQLHYKNSLGIKLGQRSN